MSNPFHYSEPVTPEQMLDRDEQAAWLVERAFGAHNSRVVGPRRYGKTSLIRRALRDLEGEGFATVYVSFFGVLTAAEISQRIERAYSTQLPRSLAQWFAVTLRSLRPSVALRAGVPGVASGSVSVELAEAHQGLLDRLALPAKLYEQRGIRAAIVFDEFQDVLAASDRMDAVIRSEIEHHGDAASYIFAGSHVGMMRELFGSKRRAFYGQASPVDLGPLSAADIAAHLTETFAAGNRELGDALGGILDIGQGHPQRTMLLAHFLWETTAPGTTAGAEEFDRALTHVMDVEVGDELRTLWTGLPETQRRVLAAVADNTAGLFSAATQARVGGNRSGYLKQAAEELIGSGDLRSDPMSPTGYQLVDPLLAHWVKHSRARS